MSQDVDPLLEIKQTFFQECDELLGDLERGLMAIEGGDHESETINLVFRAVHSIKGGAGAFGLDALVRFAHVFEGTLEELRSGTLQPNANLVKAMLVAADLLADLVREARGDASVDPSRSIAVTERLRHAAFEPALPAAAAAESGDEAAVQPPLQDDPFGLGFQPVVISFDLEPEPEPEPEGAAQQTWIVDFRPAASFYARASEPLILLRELSAIGTATVELDETGIPLLDALELEDGYLAWSVEVVTDQDRAAIQDVFSFVEDDCALTIRSATVAPAEPGPPTVARMMEQIAETFPAAPAPPTGAAPVAGTVTPFPARAVTPPALADDPQAAKQAAAPQSIRVELDRIDRLVDIVGELVINQAMLAQSISESGMGRASAVVKGLEELEHLTRDMQESVMAIRAQPVRSVFQRMPRLVREVAAMVSKEARLVTEGEGTEVDKTVIERLSDPITHMIRNAIDHGLESPADRLAAGKVAEGTVRLSAAHRSGRIVIEVGDDGRGINRERVRAIAIKKGLISPEAQLNDEEIDNLIFLPGFSTAAELSDISGRGVGMDIVRSSILALGGRISIASRPGHGSTFTLSLPLTLAVLDGMVVTIAGQTLVVPLTAVVETLQPKSTNIRWMGPDAPLVVMRDSYIPLLDVGHRLGYRAEPLQPTSGVVLLVEVGNGNRMALLVDAIQGQRQVVIKSLEANYQAVEGIAAATILGDGRIALILDVEAVSAMPQNDAMGQSPLRLATG